MLNRTRLAYGGETPLFCFLSVDLAGMAAKSLNTIDYKKHDPLMILDESLIYIDSRSDVYVLFTDELKKELVKLIGVPLYESEAQAIVNKLELDGYIKKMTNDGKVILNQFQITFTGRVFCSQGGYRAERSSRQTKEQIAQSLLDFENGILEKQSTFQQKQTEQITAQTGLVAQNTQIQRSVRTLTIVIAVTGGLAVLVQYLSAAAEHGWWPFSIEIYWPLIAIVALIYWLF
jgi:hypothetical protein